MRAQGRLAVEIEVEVPFHDVDLAGVVWHGHYLKYLENARWRLMDSIGCGLQWMLSSGFSWPIVDMQIKYLRISKYAESLRIKASLVEWDSRLTVNYLITDRLSGERVARAQSRQVAVETATGILQFAPPLAFTDCVRAALAQAAAGAADAMAGDRSTGAA